MTSIWKRVVAWFNMRTDKQRKRALERLAICTHCKHRAQAQCSIRKRAIKTMVWDDGEKCPVGLWKK